MSRLPTNWRTIISKKFLHCYKRSRTLITFPILGIWERDWESPENLTLEANGIWLQIFHMTGETYSLRAKTKHCVHQGPGETRSDPTRDLPVSGQESLEEVWVNHGLSWGQGPWIHQCWHKSFRMRLPLLPLPLP